MHLRLRNPFVFTLWLAVSTAVSPLVLTPSVGAQEIRKAEGDPPASEKAATQDPDRADTESQDPTPEAPPTVKAETLETLLASLAAKRIELEQAETVLSRAISAADRDTASKVVQELSEEVDRMESRFAALATGVDISQFSDAQPKFDLNREVQSLLEPLIEQLKSVTEGPRRIEHLKQEIARAEEQRSAAGRVILGVNARDEATEDTAIESELNRIREDWVKIRDEANSTIHVAEAELETMIAQRKPFLESSQEWLDEAFRNRGKSIVFAVLAAIGVYLALGLIRKSLGRVRALRKRHDRSFYARLFDVLWTIFTYVGMFVAVLLVFYFADDWLMLLLVLIVVVGAVWASVQVLPRIVEQIQLVLNLSAARESERILWDGVPYSIHRLGFYTTLLNPALSGGRIRIPVRELIGRYSRPVAENERWFPSAEGDWVILADGTRGCVTMQTPEMVNLMLPGGNPKTYASPDYIAQSPRVISEGFRIVERFGVDYGLQRISTTEIPQKMLERLQRELPAVVGAENLKRVTVNFASASASSLDYEIHVDCEGGAAERYNNIRLAVSRILVDACNDNNWNIPFSQLTIHNAAS